MDEWRPTLYLFSVYLYCTQVTKTRLSMSLCTCTGTTCIYHATVSTVASITVQVKHSNCSKATISSTAQESLRSDQIQGLKPHHRLGCD